MTSVVGARGSSPLMLACKFSEWLHERRVVYLNSKVVDLLHLYDHRIS